MQPENEQSKFFLLKMEKIEPMATNYHDADI